MDENQLILTVGLPYSGKTTWARKQGVPIVSPDQIRLALHGRRYEQRAEEMVWTIARVMVRALFGAGHRRVIVDATHNSEKRRKPWESEDWRLVYEVFSATREECRKRAEAVGDEEILPVIDRMAEEHEPIDAKSDSRAE